jgi:hypothetical protein
MGRAKLKGETMTRWVTRHAEALWEASQALRKVQREYGGENQKAKDAWEYDYYQTPSEANSGPFRDDGKLDEEDDEASESWKDIGEAHGREGGRTRLGSPKPMTPQQTGTSAMRSSSLSSWGFLTSASIRFGCE